jgi:hypothetical protein
MVSPVSIIGTDMRCSTYSFGCYSSPDITHQIKLTELSRAAKAKNIRRIDAGIAFALPHGRRKEIRKQVIGRWREIKYQ